MTDDVKRVLGVEVWVEKGENFTAEEVKGVLVGRMAERANKEDAPTILEGDVGVFRLLDIRQYANKPRHGNEVREKIGFTGGHGEHGVDCGVGIQLAGE
jgi:hypothetical protein